MLPKIPVKNINYRPARDDDRSRLANLIHFGKNVHRHLDWRHPLDWICCRPYIVAEWQSQLIAALACPSETDDVAWLRLFAADPPISPRNAWNAMWPVARHDLAESVRIVAAIPLQDWFQILLEESKFEHSYDVVMMVRHNTNLPAESYLRGYSIRPMKPSDLPAVQAIDEKAFDPVWRHSLDLLEIAYQQAAVASVAESSTADQSAADESAKIIGYQISTVSSGGGHLARLAVHPRLQSHGVGHALLDDLLAKFFRRGIEKVTVNTQLDNKVSLALYQKMGFEKTGECYPVYMKDLD